LPLGALCPRRPDSQAGQEPPLLHDFNTIWDIPLVDVGVNFGIFTLAALRYDGADPAVYVVASAKAPLRALRENVRLAHASERVTVLDIAVGPSDGELTMLTTGADRTQSGCSRCSPRVQSLRGRRVSRIAARDRHSSDCASFVRLDVTSRLAPPARGARDNVVACESLRRGKSNRWLSYGSIERAKRRGMSTPAWR
jgi:FkbM family methyltransferase